MLWCDTWPANGGGFHYINQGIANLGYDYDGPLMFLNEPELASQCDMTPAEAAAFYEQARDTFPLAHFVGPNISSDGLPWLAEWYDLIIADGLPLPETAAIHSYLDEEPHLLIDRLFAVLDDYPGAAGKVWVSEFGNCNPEQAQNMIESYQSDTRVERYAWFTVRNWDTPDCLNLLDGNDELTAVGEVWKGSHGE